MDFATRERRRRQDAASIKLDQLRGDATDEEIIAAAADYLIASGPGDDGKWHLSIINAGKPVPHDWQRKNVSGISAPDAARAREWISECMRLGFGVFYSSAKRGVGFGAGNIERIRDRAARQRPQEARRAASQAAGGL